MKLHFIKCNPAENMTILVMDPVPEELRTDIASRLLAQKHLHAEQIGFVEKPHDAQNGSLLRLEMMGGEFCANATRSLAAVMAFKGYPARNGDQEGLHYRLEVSGAQHPVDCQVFQISGKESTYVVEAGLPLPLSWEKMMLLNHQEPVAGTLVRFPGISHLVVDKNDIAHPEAFFHQINKQLAGSQDDAFGIMFFDRSCSYIEPLVWVRATDTLLWEKGCGSGTAAIGVVLAAENRKNCQERILQPGGALDISVKWQETITAISLSGEVELVAEGTAYVSLN